MSELREEQLERLNQIEKQVEELLNSTPDNNLKQDYNFFIQLLKYAKEGDFFIFRTANQNKKLEEGDLSAKKFFRGTHYTITTFHEFKKSKNFKENQNRANVYPISFMMNREGKFRLHINVSGNRELVNLIDSEILPELKKVIDLEEKINDSSKLFMESDTFEDLDSLISQVKPTLDKIFQNKDYIEKWTFNNFVKQFEKRLKFIKHNFSQSDNSSTQIEQFEQLFANKEEKQWFISIFGKYLNLLNFNSENQYLFTMNMKKKSHFRVNYGPILIFDYKIIENQPYITIAMKERDNIEKFESDEPFKNNRMRKDTFRLYTLSRKKFIEHKDELDKYISNDLPIINELFSDYKANPYKNSDNLELKKYISSLLQINLETQDTKHTTKIESNIQNKKQIILYGPPGTGKTYNTKGIIKNFTQENYEILEQEGRVKFITFHQSYAYEEFIEGIKPNLDGNKEISYNIESGSFKSITENIINNVLINKEIGLISANKFEQAIDNFKEKLANEEELELKTEKGEKFKVSYRNGKTFRIKPLNSKTDYDYPANIENIKSLYFKTKELNQIYNPSYVKGILNYLIENNYILENKKELKNIYQDITREQRKELFKDSKPYFLIIDEINRGNISKIFGELITLLEADKRLGEDNELITELPYSKEQFGVPPNLYIIATMNTADKSIASLDLALRRRFGFQEMLPDSKYVPEYIEDISLKEIFIIINKRIEYLLDKDHLLGHSYFMKIDSIGKLKEVFYNEVIPLLEEYFYGNYERLYSVLGESFFEKKESKNINKIFEGDEEIMEDTIYKLKELNNEDFKLALKKIQDYNIKDE